MSITGREVWRDFVTDGVPSSGNHNPAKLEIRQWAAWIEQFISAFTSAGGLIYPNKAAIDADLARAANTMAWVVGDAIASNNGIYRKVGASGTGSWVRVADLPYSFIPANDAGGGGPNAIVATSPLPVSSSALVLLNVFRGNTASPVTVSFNGGAPLTIKTNSGQDVSPGGLVSGMLLLGRVSGAEFRLASDQASTAVLAQMEQLLADTTQQIDQIIEGAVDQFTIDTQDLRDQAQSAANAAAAAAKDAEMYAEMVGAAVYDFSFDSDPDLPGYDWSE